MILLDTIEETDMADHSTVATAQTNEGRQQREDQGDALPFRNAPKTFSSQTSHWR